MREASGLSGGQAIDAQGELLAGRRRGQQIIAAGAIEEEQIGAAVAVEVERCGGVVAGERRRCDPVRLEQKTWAAASQSQPIRARARVPEEQIGTRVVIEVAASELRE